MDWEWVDYDDFDKRYWTDHTMSSKFGIVFNFYDGIGFLWKTGVIDLDDVSVRFFGACCLVHAQQTQVQHARE